MNTRTHVDTYTHTHVHIYTHTHIHTYINTRWYSDAYTHVRTSWRMYACAHVRERRTKTIEKKNVVCICTIEKRIVVCVANPPPPCPAPLHSHTIMVCRSTVTEEDRFCSWSFASGLSLRISSSMCTTPISKDGRDVWHDSFICVTSECVTWLVHMWDVWVCDITRSYVCHPTCSDASSLLKIKVKKRARSNERESAQEWERSGVGAC